MMAFGRGCAAGWQIFAKERAAIVFQISQKVTAATMSHIGRQKSRPKMIPFAAAIGIVNPPRLVLPLLKLASKSDSRT